MAAAFLVLGVVAYFMLPVAALPQVDFPTIQVQANLPGASPETMASNVAQPLERQFSLIAGITQMTSTSQLSQTRVVLQFDLSRNIDAAAQDVLTEINAASGQLPTNLPSAPSLFKANPADTAIITMGVSSDVLPMRTVSDYADNILSQQISRLPGVGQVVILGQQKPAIRVQIDPRKAAALGLQLDAIRTQLAAATVNAPKGSLVGPNTTSAIYANDQLTDVRTWNNLIVGYKAGAPIRVKDLGRAIQGVENNQIGAYNFPGKANPDPTALSGQGLIL
jgi:HAE1 family hydrophobic/amphiphilic exporter-1